MKHMISSFIILSIITLIISDSRLQPLDPSCKEVKCPFETMNDLFYYYQNNIIDFDPKILDTDLLICLLGNFNCPYMRNNFNFDDGTFKNTLEPNSGVFVGMGIDLSKISNVTGLTVPPTLGKFLNSPSQTASQDQFKTAQTNFSFYVFDSAVIDKFSSEFLSLRLNELTTKYTTEKIATSLPFASLPSVVQTVLLTLYYNNYNFQTKYKTIWTNILENDWINLSDSLSNLNDLDSPLNSYQKTLVVNILQSTYWNLPKAVVNPTLSAMNLVYTIDFAPYVLRMNSTTPCNGNDVSQRNSPQAECNYLYSITKILAGSIDLLFKRTVYMSASLSIMPEVTLIGFCGGYSKPLGLINSLSTNASALFSNMTTIASDFAKNCGPGTSLIDSIMNTFIQIIEMTKTSDNARPKAVIVHTDVSFPQTVDAAPTFALDTFLNNGIPVIVQAFGALGTNQLPISNNYVNFLQYASKTINMINHESVKAAFNANSDLTIMTNLNNYVVAVPAVLQYDVVYNFPNLGNRVFSFQKDNRADTYITIANTGTDILTGVVSWNTFTQPTPTSFITVTKASSIYETLQDTSIAYQFAYKYPNSNFNVNSKTVYLRISNSSGYIILRNDPNYSPVTNTYTAKLNYSIPPVSTSIYTQEPVLPSKEWNDVPAPTTKFGSVQSFIALILINALFLLFGVCLFIRCRQKVIQSDRSDIILRKV